LDAGVAVVAAGVLANAVLAATLSASANLDPALVIPGGLLTIPDATIESSTQTHMQVCDSGGVGAPECDVSCHIILNFLTSSCGVSCRSGYFACCSCDTGCHCLMDHEEMWPLPPFPDPGPSRP